MVTCTAKHRYSDIMSIRLLNHFASHFALTILICCLVRLSGYLDGEKHCSNPGNSGASEGAGKTADSVRLSMTFM